MNELHARQAALEPALNSGLNLPKKKRLGLWMCTALVVGNMVGSGIFLLPSALAPFGSLSLWGWAITSVGSLLLAWVFSRLAARMPKAGGPYAYTRAGFGDFAGFLMAWGYWISCWCTNAAVAVAMVSYLAHVFPVLATTPLYGASVALGTLWLLTWINIRGVREAGYVQLITTILKLLPLLALILFGFSQFDASLLQPTIAADQNLLSPISATVALTLWAFLGLECATIPADNIHEPSKTIPRATMIGTSIAAIVYVLSTTVVMGLVSNDILATSNAPFADAAAVLWGENAAYVIAIGAVISCFGALNGWILIQAQIPKAAADDKLFPSVFSKVSSNGTPVNGLLISSGLATLIVLSNFHRGLVNLFTFIVLLATLSAVVPYIFCAMTEFMQSVKEQRQERKHSISIIVSLLAFAYSMWVVAGSGQEVVFWGFLLLLAGVPIYAWRKSGTSAVS